MGAGASAAPYPSVEEALAAGKTQAEVDAWMSDNTAAEHQEASVASTQAENNSTGEGGNAAVLPSATEEGQTVAAAPAAVEAEPALSPTEEQDADTRRDSTEGRAAESSPAAEDDDGDPDVIPASWGWPKDPYDPIVLLHWVKEHTKDSPQEQWDASLAARSLVRDDYVSDKAYANLMLNKEGTGEQREAGVYEGIDPRAYRRGRWYKYLNFNEDCYVYVHNYTRSITASRPENFGDLTEEEKRRMRKLGVYIKELPSELEKVYDKMHQIPIVHCSEYTAWSLKKFAEYGGGAGGNWQLLDCSRMGRINSRLLEEARQAIVSAMRYGKWLMIFLVEPIPEFAEKICTSKNRESFPFGVWTHGGLETDVVKEKIYREDDKESGRMIVRDGFRVCVVLPYDTMNFDFASYTKASLPDKIPNYHHMHEVRCYSEEDIAKFLANPLS